MTICSCIYDCLTGNGDGNTELYKAIEEVRPLWMRSTALRVRVWRTPKGSSAGTLGCVGRRCEVSARPVCKSVRRSEGYSVFRSRYRDDSILHNSSKYATFIEVLIGLLAAQPGRPTLPEVFRQHR